MRRIISSIRVIMKYTLTLLLLVITFLKAEAFTFDCSDSRGALRLSQWAKSGGAAPYQGMLLSTTKWHYQDVLVFEKSTYHEVELTGTLDSNIEWSLQSGTEVYLERTDTGYSTHEVFAVQIKLQSNDGQNITGMETPALIDWFICQRDNQLLP